MDWSQFIGRFHPLVVHLPIGFLLFGLLLELVGVFRKSKEPDLRKVTAWSYLAGSVGALMSALIGLLLAQGGGYEAGALSLHKWMGFALVALTAVLYWSKSKKWDKKSPVIAYGLVAVSFILVSLTGHLGGNLTHGSDYLLAHAPAPIKRLAGMSPSGSSQNTLPGNSDSILVFSHIIQPILEEKCTGCHNPSKAKGGLDLSSFEAIQSGGDEGSVLSGSSSLESELVHRVTLPTDNEKYMPPQGNGLSYGEIALLKWWVSQGATDSLKLAGEELPQEIIAVMDRDYGVDASPRSFIEKLLPPEVDDEKIAQANETGLMVSRLTPDSQILELRLTSNKLTSSAPGVLEDMAQNIVYADFSGAKLSPEDFGAIGKMQNLIRIDLRHSNVSDEQMETLANLPHLEVVNVYGTGISKAGFDALAKTPQKLKIYLWKTAVSNEELQTLRQDYPHLELIGGRMKR
ncbi:hypothetical protein DN752_04965 [Echinicola strongylocentroti]|uniref:Uncharacterized protein n=1 Tax=Echinicola strongylocentroti TaxID=1795355 RepID=A0A2Z4IEM2_9BACT|nr:DUF2231 domain-containing protein [Echinicola strongylocentroti]AWW29532.1 hypothetical protein DN752_04965 [Echinicola strongylocentroti]